jgi:hypothetical protein
MTATCFTRHCVLEPHASGPHQNSLGQWFETVMDMVVSDPSDDSTRPMRERDELWSAMDWTLWGQGMADFVREPMADVMVAALDDEQHALAVALIEQTANGYKGLPIMQSLYVEMRRENERLNAVVESVVNALDKAEKDADEDLGERSIRAHIAQVHGTDPTAPQPALVSSFALRKAMKNALPRDPDMLMKRIASNLELEFCTSYTARTQMATEGGISRFKAYGMAEKVVRNAIRDLAEETAAEQAAADFAHIDDPDCNCDDCEADNEDSNE